MSDERPFADDPIVYLSAELQSRRARRANYSLRAFARDLHLSPSTVSEILSGKVGLSPMKSRLVAKLLKLPSPHDEHFCDLISAKHARSDIERRSAQKRATNRLQASGAFDSERKESLGPDDGKG